MRVHTAFLVLFTLSSLLGQSGVHRYAVILQDPPAAQSVRTLREGARAALPGARRRVEAAQAAIRDELARRSIRITGSAQVLLNAVFIEATPEQAAEIAALAGVQRAAMLPRRRLLLNRAVQLVNAPAAWNSAGGTGKAGSGVKIGILDTGIDQTHPAFQDASLPTPPGFPKCSGADCAFTSNKVIVARSYVNLLAAGTPPNPAANSRPDDLSPRDRVGHGTALAMIAAGETNTGPAATITGMAPKAWLGNYKIFGSPEVNDFTGSDSIIMALEDAVNDGMDVAVLSLGGPALSGALDRGMACGASGNTPCEPDAIAAENATQLGMTVVCAAGNEGDQGSEVPTLGTIDSPAIAPSAIAVGASTNSHTFVSSVRVPGTNVPQPLQQISAQFGDGPAPAQPLTAPLRDVTPLRNDSTGCLSFPAGSLNGFIALILRGSCSFTVKVANAQNAGAVGVVFYDSGSGLTPPGGLINTVIPALMISNSDGIALRTFVTANPDHPVTIDPTPVEVDVKSFNQIASFSSRGPAIGSGALKPELVAVGTNMYLATQSYDPNGELYNAGGYTVSQGTSFSTPMVAGAAALVKQLHPAFSPAQIKSALVSTATSDVTDPFGSTRVTAAGGGKLDAGGAVNVAVTVEPATLSFGFLKETSLPSVQRLRITNTGAGAANLSFAVSAHSTDANAQISPDKSTLALAAGQSDFVTFTLSGNTPLPGSYDGYVNMQGVSGQMRIPYLYVVGDGVPNNAMALLGDGFDGTVGQGIVDGGIAFKIIDRYGAPVAGVPVQFQATAGGGQISDADPATDQNGIATAVVTLGQQLGSQQFTGSARGFRVTFTGFARPMPQIGDGGVVSAASNQIGAGVAPGSLISIYGSGLSDGLNVANTTRLPLALDYVSVSFDVPSAGLSLPGRVYYVSPRQVNVQAPWELKGQPSALVKVTVEDSPGNVVSVPVSDYAPAIFERSDESTGQTLAAALDGQSHLITTSNAARRGDVIQIYTSGLGPVDHPPADGEPAPAQPLASTLVTPTVTIGGRPAAVQFSGLAPGFVGLYQLNVTVPPDVAPGVQPLVITQNGVVSKTSNIPVQ